MTIMPLQFFGLGDVIFCQTLVNTIANSYGSDTRIVWGVWDNFLDQLNRAYPNIEFVPYKSLGIDFNRKDDYEFMHAKYGRCRVLPLRWADGILNVHYNSCMRAKYDLYGLDFETWRDNAMWQRNEWKEIGFHASKVPKGDYALVNLTFGSDAKGMIKIPHPKISTIVMDIVKGYSLFDWSMIIENATEIHTVNTSIIYLLEMLDLRAKEVHLYQRTVAGQTFDNIRYVLKRHKYVFHG